MTKAGLRSALAHQPKKRTASMAAQGREKKRKKGERKINLAKATNQHLPSLFTGAQPVNIDER